MFVHEAFARESSARVVESLRTAKRDVFDTVDVGTNSDRDPLDCVMLAMDHWSSLLACGLQEAKWSLGPATSQVTSMSRAMIAAELSTNRFFLGKITLTASRCIVCLVAVRLTGSLKLLRVNGYIHVEIGRDLHHYDRLGI